MLATMRRPPIAPPTTAIFALTQCVGHITGHPEWPVVLTELGRVRLSHTIALVAGFGTPAEPTHITFRGSSHTITRLAIIADDICALDITPPHAGPPAVSTPDSILARPDNLLALIRTDHRLAHEIAHVQLHGYRSHHAYIQPHPGYIGQPLLLQTNTPPIAHLVGFIETIEPEYICTSRYIPRSNP